MRTNDQVCTRCVMDTTAIDISFDSIGVCNYCKHHEDIVSIAPFRQRDHKSRLANLIKTIKKQRKGDYDSIVGISGGVDSAYVAYKAVEYGLNPLVVHFDNGWNSELAIKNIEQIVKRLKLDLVTYVIDWEEFRDIQLSFIKANVIDIEMVTDHAIFAAIYKVAKKHKIRHILSGTNVATESIMPEAWQHFKFDMANLVAIHNRYGSLPIKKYPILSIWGMAWNHYIYGAKSISILNYADYRKHEAIEILENDLGWQRYGNKHHESIFTKFYQAYILPNKFGIDKRRAHFSDLIMNGEMSRTEALSELEKRSYNPNELDQDTDYVCKKLGLTREQFINYMQTAPVSHYSFTSSAKFLRKVVKLHKRFKRL
jgi:N-acetyl sugar amidotransferase